MKLNDLKNAHADAISSFAESVRESCSFLQRAEESACDQWLTFSKSEVIIKVMSALNQKAYLIEKLQADGLPVDENPLVSHLSELEQKTIERHGEWRESCASTRQEIDAMVSCLGSDFDYELIDAIVEAFSSPLLASLRFESPIGELESLSVIKKIRSLEDRLGQNGDDSSNVEFVTDESVLELAKNCVAKAGINLNSLPDYLTFDWSATAQKFASSLETVEIGSNRYYVAP